MGNLAGQQLGNYRLLKLLGKGGFAEVYLGQHVRLASKQAAIKVLHLLDVDARRFQEEAETTEKLVHPHIVRLLDFDIEEGTLFLVLDYAPGGSLRARHPKGSVVPLASVAAYLKELAPALQYAHDQHILHRDIKPDNMLIGRQGEVLLSDFGIAVLMQTGHTPSSFTYGIGGTPYYMAPEAYRGKPDRTSDQYALAVVVYEWLCGSVPFSEGDFIQLGYQHAHEPVPPLREKNPALPPEVEAVIKKALAKEPKERFASVQTFLLTFEQACAQARQAEQERLRQAEAQELARLAEEERLRQAERAHKQVEEWYQAEEERARQEREERARQAREKWEKDREERARQAKEKWEKAKEELERITAAEQSSNETTKETLPPLSELLAMASSPSENLRARNADEDQMGQPKSVNKQHVTATEGNKHNFSWCLDFSAIIDALKGTAIIWLIESLSISVLFSHLLGLPWVTLAALPCIIFLFGWCLTSNSPNIMVSLYASFGILWCIAFFSLVSLFLPDSPLYIFAIESVLVGIVGNSVGFIGHGFLRRRFNP